METEFRPDYAIHPGVILKEDMEMVQITQKEISARTGIPKTVINEIIKGKRNINANIAVRLEYVLFSPAKYWLNLQSAYDEAIARKKLNKEINRNQSCSENIKIIALPENLYLLNYTCEAA